MKKILTLMILLNLAGVGFAPASTGEEFLHRLQAELQLNPEQVILLRNLIRSRPADWEARLKSILSTEQWLRYQQTWGPRYGLG